MSGPLRGGSLVGGLRNQLGDVAVLPPHHLAGAGKQQDAMVDSAGAESVGNFDGGRLTLWRGEVGPGREQVPDEVRLTVLAALVTRI